MPDPSALLALPGPLLAPLAALYRAGVATHAGVYRAGLLRAERLPVPVLSVGNLAVGGTGKTPTVRELARAAMRAGFRPVILTRGYGGRGDRMTLEAGRTRRRRADSAETGDEPLLLSRALPDVPVLVARDRAAMARRFLDGGGAADVFLLDDGFQHRALARDFDLVLVDALRPFGNGHVLPRGILREPRSALARAGMLLCTAAGGVTAIDPDAETALAAAAPGVPRKFARAVLRAVRSLAAPERVRDVAGCRVHGVAAIARPERFRILLEDAGAEVAGWSTYRDHHRFARAEIEAEERAAVRAGAVLVTTAKDAVRLEDAASPDAEWWVAEMELEVDGGWDRLFAAMMQGSGGP